MKETTTCCLDGSMLTVQSEAQDVSARETHITRANIAGRVFELSASRTDTLGSVAESMAMSLGAGPYAERHSYRGASVRFARARSIDPVSRAADDLLLMCWEGQSHVLVLPTYHTSPEGAIGLLEQLEVTERPDGVVCAPRGRGVTLDAPDVVWEVAHVGLLEIAYLSDEVRRSLPPWEGTRLASGELFKDYLGNGDPLLHPRER